MRFFEDIIQNHEFDSHAETIAVIPTTTLTVPPICLPPLVFKNQGECVSTVEATYHGGKIYPEELEYYKEVCKQGEVGWAQVATFIAQVCRPGECGLPS